MNLNNDYTNIIYQRVKEIQPHLALLVQDYKAMGMTNEEINMEICFAIMHEGYRLRFIEEESIYEFKRINKTIQ